MPQTASVGLESSTYDKLVYDALNAKTFSQALGFYRQAESLLLRDALVIPLVHTSTSYLKALHVRGYEPNIWDLHYWEKIQVP